MQQEGKAKRRILIVEDDVTLAGGLCRALQNDGVMTIGCHTLREAAGLLGMTENVSCTERISPDRTADDSPRKQQAATFDLVLLDVNLPDGSGFEFLQEIKRKYDICVIMLTANDMETDIVAGLEMGADDYITKPFSLAVLRARVETQLRRVAQQKSVQSAEGNHAADGSGITGGMADGSTANGSDADTVLQSIEESWIIDGAYRFHFAQMLFFHGEEQAELSKTEQRLLRMLVENRNRTVTREQLLAFTWSVDAAFVDENALSVAVKRLRDKLGAQEKIKTVYGIGYRWEQG